MNNSRPSSHEYQVPLARALDRFPRLTFERLVHKLMWMLCRLEKKYYNLAPDNILVEQDLYDCKLIDATCFDHTEDLEILQFYPPRYWKSLEKLDCDNDDSVAAYIIRHLLTGGSPFYDADQTKFRSNLINKNITTTPDVTCYPQEMWVCEYVIRNGGSVWDADIAHTEYILNFVDCEATTVCPVDEKSTAGAHTGEKPAARPSPSATDSGGHETEATSENRTPVVCEFD